MIIFILSFFSFCSFAEQVDFHKTALRLINGEIVNEYRYYQVKTSKGSVVDLLLDKEGIFQKARGQDPDKDELFIGVAGLSFSDALKLARKNNLKPTEWNIEQEGREWFYSFREIRKNCEEREIKINASNGTLVK